MKLTGKTALITGGTSGIGAATAMLFRDEGARVIVTGRRDSVARASLPGIEAIESDASDVAAIDRLAREVGPIDIAFLNAGVSPNIRIADLTEAAFDHVFGVNVKGPLFAIRALAPHMPDGSAIVVCGSIVADMGAAGNALYGASKAAVHLIARVAAIELAPRNIRVTVLAPGPTKTDIVGKHGGDQAAIHAHLAAAIPLRRMAEPSEIARAALFLATDATFMTGSEMIVDGGFSRV